VVALLLALLAAPESVETEHYRLVSEGPRAEAEEFARVLEAAWGGLAAYFEGAPKLRKGERLEVRFFETRDAWAADVSAAGATPPEGAGGYYWETDRIARLYRQPTRLFTRALLLHEATHQFHFLARTRNRAPVAYWYKEGVAECLGWNAWDGERLTLGVLPLVALENYPAQALAELSGGLDVEAIIEGRAEPSRPVAWAIYRHLSAGNAGKPLKGFDRIAEKLDAGAKPSAAFWKTFGRPPAYRKALLHWIEKEQQPFVPVFNEWEPVGPDRVRGFAGGVTLCRLQAKATTLRAAIEPPRGDGVAWRAGGLLHFEGPDDYTVFLFDQGGRLRVSRRNAGAWQVLEEGAGAVPGEDGKVRFELAMGEGGVRLVLGDVTRGPWEPGKPALGLALDACDLVFGDLSWK